MLFDIYGRFEVEVLKISDGWMAYRYSNGLRAPLRDLVLPDNLKESDLEQFLDDHYHEYALPGQAVRRIDS
jgi:hypothetical protein